MPKPAGHSMALLSSVAGRSDTCDGLALSRMGALNVDRRYRTFEEWEFFESRKVMPKKAGATSSALENSSTGQFVSIALFSGVGLLISLVIVICRMHGVF